MTSLQERSKWTHRVPNISVDNMVVVIENNIAPLTWWIGRVAEVLPGYDGTVRVARVLTSTGYLTRPIAKLVPLPVDG